MTTKKTPNPNAVRAIVDARKEKPSFQVSESPRIVVLYTRDLNRLVNRMIKAVKEKLYPVLKKYSYKFDKADKSGPKESFRVTDDSFGIELLNAYQGLQDEYALLDAWAKRVAFERLTQAAKSNRKSFIDAWKKAVGVDVSQLLAVPISYRDKELDRDTVLTVNRAIGKNVDLIKTIPKQQLERIKVAIEKGIATGDETYSLRSLINELDNIGKDTKNRAKLIARDQLSKLNGELVQARQESLGIKSYVWRTSHDQRVRPSHKENDGKVFQWNNPPKTGHPGQDYYCRCSAEPDLSQFTPFAAPELQKLGPRRRNRISV